MELQGTLELVQKIDVELDVVNTRLEEHGLTGDKEIMTAYDTAADAILDLADAIARRLPDN